MNGYHGFSRGWSSPERYVQGPGEFRRLKEYTDIFGKKIAAFIDGFLYKEYQEKLCVIYKDSECEVKTIPFRGEVTRKRIDDDAEKLAKWNPDVILGIGGGKTIDAAKAVGIKLKCRFVIVPTIASTDAPTSSLSVIYREDGTHEGELFHDHSPSLLVVDSQIIALAPVRFLVSGMGDALATLIEAEANAQSDTPNLVYHKKGGMRQTLAGKAIARECYVSLMKYGLLAKKACENHVVTEALENIIETNILLSGLGFENNETAGAHSVNDGLTVVKNSEKTMHGEKVAFGCIVQLMLQCADERKLKEVLGFCMNVGLPVCLEDLYVENTEENIRKIAEVSMHSNWKNMPFAVNAESVYAAIKAADSYGREFRNDWRKEGASHDIQR